MTSFFNFQALFTIMYVSHKVNDMYCSIICVHLIYYTPTQATKALVQICFAAALNVKLSLIE